ncbi:Alpha/Beta hydrolase protein [Aspergillus spinulosporus]
MMKYLTALEVIANVTKIQGVDLIQETYKYIGDHPICADILLPQTTYEGKRPIVARFHGGGQVIGDSLYMDWSPYWLSDLALEHEAVIVSANYCMMPQATGLDIYDDIEDFWAWLQSPAVEDNLAAYTTPTKIDLAHILVTGESAGGLLSINSALQLASSHSVRIPARAAIGMYPTHFDELIIGEIMDTAPDGPITLTSGDCLPLMLAVIEHGYLREWYARGSKHSEVLYPLQQLKKRVRIPRGGITILQELNDTVVSLHHSEPFIARLNKVTKSQPGNDKIQFITHEGEHGFDGDLRYIEEPWLQEALRPAVDVWLD